MWSETPFILFSLSLSFILWMDILQDVGTTEVYIRISSLTLDTYSDHSAWLNVINTSTMCIVCPFFSVYQLCFCGSVRHSGISTNRSMNPEWLRASATARPVDMKTTDWNAHPVISDLVAKNFNKTAFSFHIFFFHFFFPYFSFFGSYSSDV
jgi:hypothetical protein